MKLIPTSTNPVTITLYRNYPFDNSYKETTLLSRKFKYGDVVVGADKDGFLDLKDSTNTSYYFPRTTKTGTYNFAFGNGLVTSLILELTDEEINTNYIKVECSVTHEVYYYFVTSILQKNEMTYLLNLELDIFMTYGEDFLDMMNGIPVMTERKHCYRFSEYGYPISAEFTKVDSNFSNVKANIFASSTKLALSVKDVNNVKLKSYNWCYVIVKADDSNYKYLYKENGILHSYLVICFPMVTMKLYRMNGSTQTELVTYDPLEQMKFWGTFENTYKITILPYPPFNNLGTNTIISQTNTELDILIDSANISPVSQESGAYNVYFSPTTYARVVTGSTHPYIAIREGFGGAMNYDNITLFNYTDYNSVPRITNGKNKGELTIALPPFTKYKIGSFADEGYYFNPQLKFGLAVYGSEWKTYQVKTIVSTNPDNTSYFTYVTCMGGELENKIGLGTTYFYSMPTSVSAMQHFLNTASAEYNNSKLMSTISAFASIGLGGASMSVAKSGSMGQIAGAGAIASGIIKEVDNITSYYAKMEDLKNTPSNLTTGGSTFTLDYAMSLSSNMDMLPFISIFICDYATRETASDFFYNYGYEVNRYCNFNTSLSFYSSQPGVNNSIFTRTLFNYVKLSENITNKLCSVNGTANAIPYVVAKKFAEVFMNGITIWTFFGFTSIQNKINDVTNAKFEVFTYFHKSHRCNAEFYNLES